MESLNARRGCTLNHERTTVRFFGLQVWVYFLRLVDSAWLGRCHHVRCFECTRDATADTQSVELGVPDFTTRRPWFDTEMTIGFRPRRGRNATLNLIFFFWKKSSKSNKNKLFFVWVGAPQHDKTAHRGEPRDDDHFGHISSQWFS